MSWSRPLKLVSVGLTCIGVILPGSVLEGAQPASRTSRGMPLVSDLELGPKGSLRGFVVNVHGVPIARAPVVVRNADREVARTSTDLLGQFSVDGLRGGIYQVGTGRYARQFRTWVARTAPPRAKQIALIVVGGDVVRGQMPLEDFFASDAFIITGMVGAMIAIPVVVHQSNQRRPSSP